MRRSLLATLLLREQGLGRQPTRVWQTYQNRKGGVIYGGRPLGKAPRSKAYRVKR